MGETVTTRAPGVYDMPEAEYRADPALSFSGAKRLLELPAKFDHDRRTGERHAAHFDFGKAAHALVLGAGAPVDVLDFPDWRTKDARAARAEAYDAGRIPVLADDWAVVEAMAAKVRDHPVAAALLDPDRGKPEQSLFWVDPRTGVNLKSRFDQLPRIPERGRMVIGDYKTAPAADRRSFGRAAASFGYHQQHAWYSDGAAIVLDIEPPAFVFIVQEREAPYLVNVVELDADAVAVGRDRNRRAIDIYVECTESGVWPDYGPEVQTVSLPRWAQMQHDDDMADWPDPNPDQF